MAFAIRYRIDDTYYVRELDPSPSSVDYPGENVTITTSVDGNTILQRPMRDSRPRSWTFGGWSKTSQPFADAWAFLESMNTRARYVEGQEATVGIWEDITNTGGFGRLDDEGERVYTTVRIVRTDRVIIGRGSPVNYDSTVEFYISDSTYDAF